MRQPPGNTGRPTPKSEPTRRHHGTARHHPGRGPCGRASRCLRCRRSLRNAYGVSPQMRERVTAAIEALGYRPNAGARAMRGRSYTIGVVIAEFGTPFQLEIAQAIADELEPTPFQVVVVAGGTTPERQKPRHRGSHRPSGRRPDPGRAVAGRRIDRARSDKALPIVTVALHGTPDSTSTPWSTTKASAPGSSSTIWSPSVTAGSSTPGMPRGELGGDFVLSHTARRQGSNRRCAATTSSRTSSRPTTPRRAATTPRCKPSDRSPRRRPSSPVRTSPHSACCAPPKSDGLRVPEDLTVVGYDNIYTSTINRVSLTTVDQSGHLDRSGQHPPAAGTHQRPQRAETIRSGPAARHPRYQCGTSTGTAAPHLIIVKPVMTRCAYG